MSDVKALIPDDPEFDGTDAAHPAWWRGEHAGSLGVVRCVNEWLDGKVAGTPAATEMQELKARITALRIAALAAGARPCDVEMGVMDWGYRCTRWKGHAGPHREGTTEWT